MVLPTPSRDRVYSIDVLRGIVMILMALDHVRDFFHTGAMTSDPLDPETTHTALYLTRWVTHFCAPIFVFLSGLSVFLMNGRKTKAEISKFLLTRGLWLIVVEVTIVSLGLSFNPLFSLFFLQVIWAIGVSFVLLSLLVFLPWGAILALGAAITLSHNILDFYEAQPGFQPGLLWEFAHKRTFALHEVFPGHRAIVLYPFLPWVGVMMMGYGCGRLFAADISSRMRQSVLVTVGLGMIGLFFLLRAVNVYGDPLRWEAWHTLSQTLFSFFNVQKYPPSLLYTCATIGPGLLALAALEHARNGFTAVCNVYGSVPFFYYVLHFYLIHGLTVIAFFASGYNASQIVDPQTPFLFRPADFGFSLPVVYLVWIGVVAALYFPCKRFAAYKRNRRKWWLSYV
ncbi:heparan-alpha-glucosaminide N-acetyltransferase domain-containing protein [Chitinophaga pollutisoli]|uniref:Heparan-alpha-glucosaminide N-acetyltransferase domain-containing protein n=1 Tax=Chitinophaga pollutisoli TaxID=3133966 RepID=A0ABZ2YQA3_9BACT